MKLITQLSGTLGAMQRMAAKPGDLHSETWVERHKYVLRALVYNHLPSGSGIDIAPTLDFERSKPEVLRIDLAFHHMNEQGYYTHWTQHTLTVRPSFEFGMLITVSGVNSNGIKDYLAEMFQHALGADIDTETVNRYYADHAA